MSHIQKDSLFKAYFQVALLLPTLVFVHHFFSWFTSCLFEFFSSLFSLVCLPLIFLLCSFIFCLFSRFEFTLLLQGKRHERTDDFFPVKRYIYFNTKKKTNEETIEWHSTCFFREGKEILLRLTVFLNNGQEFPTFPFHSLAFWYSISTSHVKEANVERSPS